MQLEIGKYYATRLGTIAKIVGNGDMAMYAGSDRAGLYEFEGEMADTMTPRQWRGDGVFDDSSQNCALDLIREATPDEVIAFEAGWDSVFPTADDVVDAEFAPPEFEEVSHAKQENAAPRTYADLFDRSTGTQPPPADPPRGKTEYEIDREHRLACSAAIAFRNKAHGVMCIMLGAAALLFAASGFQ